MIYLNRPAFNIEEVLAIQKVFVSKWLAEGEKTKQFEDKIKKILDCRYAIATTSATSSLICALNSLKNHNIILVPSFTHPASLIAVLRSMLIPVLVDVNLQSMQMSKEFFPDLQASIYLPVSLFGRPLDESLYNLGGVIVEDAATSLGNSKLKADLACFSFHPRKIITTGQGGIVATNNKKYAKSIRKYKTFGGNNYLYNDILASIGLIQLEKLEKLIFIRRYKALQYYELLNKLDNIIPPEPIENHIYQSYVCMVKEGLRDKMIQELERNNIEAQIGSYALHLIPKFRRIKKLGDLKNSEYLAKNTITLPIHHELTQQDQEKISKVIARVK